jgi:alpha-glucuronidase
MRTFALLFLTILSPLCLADEPLTILIPQEPSPTVVLASKEIRRYLYLRTGQLPDIVQDNVPVPHRASVIAVAPVGSPLLSNIQLLPGVRDSLNAMPADGYCLRTLRAQDRTVLLIAGSTDIATLYGAYAFAEHLGIRFSAHGDEIPDGTIRFSLPDLSEWHSPLFATRGLQPFHDFPEGPDWWNVDDYKAIFSQMVRCG